MYIELQGAQLFEIVGLDQIVELVLRYYVVYLVQFSDIEADLIEK